MRLDPEDAIRRTLDTLEATTNGHRPEEPRERSYTEVLADTLAAIQAGDQDREMVNRAELIGRFRRRDERIDAALFKLLTEQITGRPIGAQPQGESVDLDRVEGIDALIDGFVPAHDLTLIYGEKGTGKTLAALEIAFAVIDGRGFLDHDRPAEAGGVLFIASDSGAGPLKGALQDLGLADHPAARPGPGQRFHVWAAAPEQGHAAWAATINDCARLLQFVRDHQITTVVMDSAKAICSKADLAYTDNAAVSAFLVFLKEAVCPLTSVVILNHDGREKGSHSGAKAWAEIPSVVHSITHTGNPDERSWRVVKSRMGPTREFRYRLAESGRLEPCGGVECIGDASEAILRVLTEALDRGVDSVSRGELVAEICRRWSLAPKTVDNTLSRMVRATRPDICRCSGRAGRYKLSPAAATRHSLNTRAQTGRKEVKPQSGTDFSSFPADFPRELPGTPDQFPRETPGKCQEPSQGAESAPFPSRFTLTTHAREGAGDPARITVGSSVAKWSAAERRYLPGWIVKSIDGETATIHRPGAPGQCTVRLDQLVLVEPPPAT